MKYILWLGVFPFAFAWIMHFNIISVLATVGKGPDYYEGALAGIMWVLFYVAAIIPTIGFLTDQEKKQE